MNRKTLLRAVIAAFIGIFFVAAAFAQGNFTQTGTIANSGGTLKIKGTASFGTNGGTNRIAGTVDYIGGDVGTPQTVVAYGYNNLTLSKSGALTGAKTIATGTTYVGGNFVLTGIAKGVVAARGSATTFNFDASGGTQTVTPIDYNSLTFSNGGTRQFLAGITKINGDLTVSGGVVDATTNANTIQFDGAGAQAVAAFDYDNLTVDTRAAGDVTFSSSATIGIQSAFSPAGLTGTAKYVVTGTTFDFKGTLAQTVPVFSFNNLTISTPRVGTPAITLAAGEIGVAGVFSPTVTLNTWSTGGNTMNFNGGNQNIPAFAYFDGLKTDYTTPGTYTKTAQGNLAAAAAFTNAQATITVDMGLFTLGFASATNAGTVQFADLNNGKPVGTAAGTVQYNGTVAQNVLTGTYYDLKFTNGTLTTAEKAIGAAVTAHNLTVDALSFLTVTSTVQVDNDLTNAGTITNSGTITVGL